MTVFIDQTGNDSFRGVDGIYDQVDYRGSLTDYTFTLNANGTVTVIHEDFGTDTLRSIEGFWFSGEAAWYSLEDAIALTSNSQDGFVDAFGVITGNDADNILRGSSASDAFYGGRGDDRIIGGGDEYDQAEYDGALIEFSIVRLANGNVRVSHPTWGTDTLSDIDGFWFGREGAWYSVEQAIDITAALPRFRLDDDNVLNGTTGNDVMTAATGGTNFYGGTGNDTYRGRSNAYDQVNYDGDFDDYDFTLNGDGSVTVTHPIWGTDVLRDIDGLWFNGQGEWMSVDAATSTGRAPVAEKGDFSDFANEDPAAQTDAIIFETPLDIFTFEDLLILDATLDAY